MAIIQSQQISENGLSPTFSAVSASGDKVAPSRRTFIHVKNEGSSASTTVVVNDNLSQEPSGSTCFNPDLSVVIEPGGNRMIGPIVETRFNSGGYANVSYSNSASVYIAAFEV
jgi:hypothetical protein